jgi:uncharacterized GH25 family protein
MLRRTTLALACCCLLAPAGRAHFGMLLPDSWAVKKGQPVTLTYQWGHPFEHQLFDAARPVQLLVIAPDGTKSNLTDKLKKVALPGDKGKKVTGYRLRFTPSQRGDYVFVLDAPQTWLEQDEVFVRDTVKVVLHVQAQKGWDAFLRPFFEFVPLTRPYGLEPGMVFQARLQQDDPVPGPRTLVVRRGGEQVEVERYNPTPPKKLPPDEFITRVVKTNPVGVATTTLPDAGWWSLTATRGLLDDSGNPLTRLRDGKRYPLRIRTTFWVYVSAKPATK